MGEYDCNGSSWESSMSSRQKAARRRMSGQYGKGDKRRTENAEKFRLGMRLIELSDAGKKDTDEYNETLKAWRNA